MAEAQQEKRAARRFALRIPVAIGRGENTDCSEPAQIRDVSARGRKPREGRLETSGGVEEGAAELA